ncbi:Uncharacterized protein dnm_050810 [Desulfonema magnum]|uniref:Uncharacterized protein n=1 Tax=Desulfonema magnum TaxID=45655 RepID=A0A975BPY8_9BACT|nr:Uncharacterized protein dnm_050810 [Desulfonema magnum]
MSFLSENRSRQQIRNLFGIWNLFGNYHLEFVISVFLY